MMWPDDLSSFLNKTSFFARATFGIMKDLNRRRADSGRSACSTLDGREYVKYALISTVASIVTV